MTLAEERRDLHAAIALYREVMGDRPLGWNARSFPSVNTRDLLVEEGGFLYDSDPCNDDLPYFIEVSGRRFLILPYSKTYNDSRYPVAPGYSTPAHFVANVREAVEFLVEEAEELGGTHDNHSGSRALDRAGQPGRGAAPDRRLCPAGTRGRLHATDRHGAALACAPCRPSDPFTCRLTRGRDIRSSWEGRRTPARGGLLPRSPGWSNALTG